MCCFTQKQGGHYMTVCANAADETIKAAIAAGQTDRHQGRHRHDRVKDIAARACVVAHWGVDMLYLHYAADQRRADGARDSTQWLEAVLAVTDVPVGLRRLEWKTRCAG